MRTFVVCNHYSSLRTIIAPSPWSSFLNEARETLWIDVETRQLLFFSTLYTINKEFSLDLLGACVQGSSKENPTIDYKRRANFNIT